MAGFAVELSIVLSSFGLFIAYHIWFFLIHGTGLRTTRTQTRDGRDDKFLKGIQQNRNALIGVSFLAGTVSLLAQKILEIILDSDQQDQMKAFANHDPIVREVQIAPGVVLGCNFVLLMVSMLAFAQAVRMYIHAGYFYKAASMESDHVTVGDAAEVIIQAQVAQTIGMRILFFFPVTITSAYMQALWLIGPTAMMVSAVVTMGVTAYLDFLFFDEKTFMDLLLDLQHHHPTTA